MGAAFGERRNQLLGMLGGSAKNSASSYISSKAMSSSPSFSKNDISSFDSRGNEVAETFGQRLGEHNPSSPCLGKIGSGDISDASVDSSVRRKKKEERIQSHDESVS